MSRMTRFELFCLLHLSRPAKDRAIFQILLRDRPRRILEIGLGEGLRLKRMIRLWGDRARDVGYTGIDLFEGRSTAQGPGISLKEAHRLLTSAGVRGRLLPGDPHTVLSRAANAIGPVDLVVISPGVPAESLAAAWFYVPRMLHEGSLVFQQSAGNKPLARAEIDCLAELASPARRAA